MKTILYVHDIAITALKHHYPFNICCRYW